jgi:hypothetical protein
MRTIQSLDTTKSRGAKGPEETSNQPFISLLRLFGNSHSSTVQHFRGFAQGAARLAGLPVVEFLQPAFGKGLFLASDRRKTGIRVQ